VQLATQLALLDSPCWQSQCVEWPGLALLRGLRGMAGECEWESGHSRLQTNYAGCRLLLARRLVGRPHITRLVRHERKGSPHPHPAPAPVPLPTCELSWIDDDGLLFRLIPDVAPPQEQGPHASSFYLLYALHLGFSNHTCIPPAPSPSYENLPSSYHRLIQIYMQIYTSLGDLE
jgi:hypothetical protein